MEEWKLTKIGSLCKRVCSGGTPKSTVEEYYGGGIPWLNTKEVNFNRIYSTESTISESGLNNSSAKWIDAHSVIVAMYGATAAKCAIGMIPMTTNQACCNLMIDEAIADYRFVYYALTNAYSTLASLANGGAQQNLNAQLIKDFEILLPDLQTQHRIADILSTIDDKIENNNRINHNLEEQAQALYKSWFIDFEPFKDGKFIDSELGMIPNGWQVKNLVEISQLFDSKRKPLSGKDRDQMAKLYPYYGATSIMDYVDSYIFDGTYLLMGEDGSVMTEDGYPFLQYVTGKFWPNNHAHVLQGNNGFSTEMLHCALLRKVIKSSVTGAVQAKISQANMRKILFPCPSSVILKAFDSQLQTLYCQKRCIEAQNANLASLRDSMLPQLMSGQFNC